MLATSYFCYIFCLIACFISFISIYVHKWYDIERVNTSGY